MLVHAALAQQVRVVRRNHGPVDVRVSQQRLDGVRYVSEVRSVPAPEPLAISDPVPVQRELGSLVQIAVSLGQPVELELARPLDRYSLGAVSTRQRPPRHSGRTRTVLPSTISTAYPR